MEPRHIPAGNRRKPKVFGTTSARNHGGTKAEPRRNQCHNMQNTSGILRFPHKIMPGGNVEPWWSQGGTKAKPYRKPKKTFGLWYRKCPEPSGTKVEPKRNQGGTKAAAGRQPEKN